MNTQLLIETINANEGNIITESKVEGKDVWLSGIFMQAAIKNRNGREYPLVEMVRAVDSINKQIKEYNGVCGELDHPNTIIINMDRISHVITELKIKNNDVFGKAKLLDTPMGRIAKTLVEAGLRFGVSSRGGGTVTESGLVENFTLATIDLVYTPSAPAAYPTSIVESLEMLKSGKNVMTLSEQMKHDPEAQKFFKKEIAKFISELLNKK